MKLSDLSVAMAVISVGMLSCGGSSGPANNFGAQLSGANETPAISTTASGAGTIALNGTTVNYTVSGTGLSGNATGAHIHIGAVGVA
ncbi:MAG TPA: CHRD domain-containing protein, partial [Myxococcales bacterium]